MDVDSELIRRYTHENAEEAFAALVRRHVDLVFSTALRRTHGQRQFAEDATQRVFAALARQARSLEQHPTVAGWLYVTTRHVAGDIVRSEQARRAREQAAFTMQRVSDSESSVDWHELRPELDELVGELEARERDAVVLRFFQRRTFSEVGCAMRISDDAARMRVERALEKLRRRLERRGVRSTSAALAMALTAQVSVAAPAGLATSATAAALAAIKATTALGGGMMVALLTFMSTAKITTTVLGVITISVIGIALYPARGVDARSALASSREEQASLRVKLREAQAKMTADTGATTTTPAPETVAPPLATAGHSTPVSPPISAETALESAKMKLARIPNLARNGQVRDVEGIDEDTVSVVRTWMKRDPQSAIRWLASVPPEGNQRMHTIEAFIAIELGSDPEIAFLLANSIGNESARVRRLRDVVTVWAPVDAASAATAVRTADVPENARILLLREVERSSRPR